MLVWLKQFLSSPVFPDDPDKTAVAKILNGVNLFFLILLIVIIPTLTLISGGFERTLSWTVPGFFVLLGVKILITKGYVNQASVMLLTMMWLISLFSTATGGGVQAPGYSMFVLLVLLAGILLGWRFALGIALLNSSLGFVFMWLDSLGRLPESTLPNNDFRVWLFHTITAVAIAMLMRVGFSSIREALARAQYELHQRQLSEEKFASVFMANPSALLISELDSGIVLDANESFERITGYTRDKIIGRTATELGVYIKIADREIWFNLLQESGAVRDMEMLLRHANGEIRNCLLSIETIEIGHKPCAITFVQDITERKQVEETAAQTRDDLREREAQLRTILDNLPFWVWLKDVNGRFLLVNDQFRRWRQGKSDIGKTDFDLTTLELAKKYFADEKHVMETRLPISIEEPVLVQGEYKLHETYKAPFIDEDGQLLGTFGFAHDITEKKQAEITLIESEARFRSIFEDSEIGMVLVGLKHDIVKVNHAFSHMLGFSPKELVGKFFKDITFEDDVEISLEHHKRLLRGEISNYQFEKRYVHKQGHRVWGMLNVSLVHSAQGQPSSAIAQVQDITDRKQAEADREMLIQELERRNVELERFAYTVSHDLKSPLVTIGGFLGFLERDAESGNMAQLRTDIGSIRTAAGKMRLLLDELLELSRVGRLMNPPEEIPFADIVNDAMQVTQGQLVAGQVELVVSDEFPTVIGDKTRLVEVLQNLIDNAAKFSMEQAQSNPLLLLGFAIMKMNRSFLCKIMALVFPLNIMKKYLIYSTSLILMWRERGLGWRW